MASTSISEQGKQTYLKTQEKTRITVTIIMIFDSAIKFEVVTAKFEVPVIN